MSSDDAALDKLLDALEDDPLLNEALGRKKDAAASPNKDEGTSPPRAASTDNAATSSPQSVGSAEKKVPGFASYHQTAALEPSSSDVVRPVGRLAPLTSDSGSSKAPPLELAHGLRSADFLPALDVTALKQKKEGPGTGAGTPSKGSPAKGPVTGTGSDTNSPAVSPEKPPVSGVSPMDAALSAPPNNGRRLTQDVQLMPFLFSREIASEGGIAPRRRWGNSVHVHGDCLYTFGGNVPAASTGTTPGGKATTTNDFFEFNLVTRLWEPVFCSKGEMPPPRVHHAAALDGRGHLLVHGGYDPQGELLSDTHIYDFESQEWFEVPERHKQPPARADHTAVCINKHIYVFGGRVHKKNGSGLSTSNDLWVFSVETRKWSHPKKRAPPSKEGAEQLSEEPSKLVEEESVLPEGQDAPNLPARRAGHAACAFGDYRYLLINGGENQKGILNDTWAFDTCDEKWLLMDQGANAMFPRSRHQMISAGFNLVLVGGLNEYRGAKDPSLTGLASSATVFFTDEGHPTLNYPSWTALKVHGSQTPPALRGFGLAIYHGFLCLFGGVTAGNAAPNNIKRILLTDGIPTAPGETTYSALLTSIRTLLNKGTMADMFLEHGGKRYAVHRPILSLRAPKFLEAILQCHIVNRDGNESVTYGLEGNKRVQGLSYSFTTEQLVAFLEYLYTGQLKANALPESRKDAKEQQTTTSNEQDASAMRKLLYDAGVTFQVEHLVKVLNMIDLVPDVRRRARSISSSIGPNSPESGDGTPLARRREAEEYGVALVREHMLALSASSSYVSVTLQVSDPHTSSMTTTAVVHHFIVMNRCPVLQRLLRPLFFDGRATTEVKGMTAKLVTSRRGKRAEVSLSIPVQSVKYVIRYLYAGDDAVPQEAALSVMIAAHTLGLTTLQAICESVVARDEVTGDSACAIIAMAQRYEATHLYEHAVLVAAYCFRQVKGTDAFATLPDTVKEEVTRAAREMAGKTVVAPTPATEMKSKEEYQTQFSRSQQ